MHLAALAALALSAPLQEAPGVRVRFEPLPTESFRLELTTAAPAELAPELSDQIFEALGLRLEATEAGWAGSRAGDLTDVRRLIEGVLLSDAPLHANLDRSTAHVIVRGPLIPFLDELGDEVLVDRLDSTPWERTDPPARDAARVLLETLGGAERWRALGGVRTTTRLTVDFQGSPRVIERIHVRLFDPPSTRVEQLPAGPTQVVQELSPSEILQHRGGATTRWPLSDLARTWRGETATLARLAHGLASEGPIGLRVTENDGLVAFDDNGDLVRVETDDRGRPVLLVQLAGAPDDAGRTAITAFTEDPLPFAKTYTLEGRLAMTAEILSLETID